MSVKPPKTFNLSLGTPEERGLTKKFSKASSGFTLADQQEIYDLPVGMSCMKNTPWTSKIPFLPTFVPNNEKNDDVISELGDDEKCSQVLHIEKL